jgi:hypothetical protein
MVDRTLRAWSALRRRLEQHSLELHEAVCHYPTPIARCDVQLTHAIEQRDAAFRHLRGALDLEQQRAALARDAWLMRLRDFVLGLGATPDVQLSAACRRLLAGLES